MSEIVKNALVEYSAVEMFSLVDDVESYPNFLPWCSQVDLLRRDESHTSARLHVNYRGIKTNFSTENKKLAPERMDIFLLDGPFRHLEGHWHFRQLSERGCLVEFYLNYEFYGQWLEKMVSPVFAYIAETLLDAFVNRARAMHKA